MLPNTTDILIVGAGPTGLALAIALQQAGLVPVIIDTLPHGAETSRAAAIHAHTLECLDGLGVTDVLKQQALVVKTFAIHDRNKTLFRLHFDRLPSTYRGVMMVPQDATERILADRLDALGGTVHRGVTATAIRQQADCAVVTLQTGSGTSEITARYVIGADGMHSRVREAAGLDFEGGSYPDSFVLADVTMGWSPGREEVSLWFSDAGLMVVAPLPGNRFRIVATLAEAPPHPSLEDIQHLIDTRGPKQPGNQVTSVLWSSRFHVHHRVVDSYRAGRLLLMGDAAHVHSPAGGQGMNTGLIDARVLAEALIRVVRDGESDTLLDRYGDVRRPAAVAVLDLAGRLTVMATIANRPLQLLRNGLLRCLNLLLPVKHRLVLSLSGLSRKSRSHL